MPVELEEMLMIQVHGEEVMSCPLARSFAVAELLPGVDQQAVQVVILQLLDLVEPLLDAGRDVSSTLLYIVSMAWPMRGALGTFLVVFLADQFGRLQCRPRRHLESHQLSGGGCRPLCGKIVMNAAKTGPQGILQGRAQSASHRPRIETMYKSVEENVPPSIQERLDKVKQLQDDDLHRLLIDARQQLGNREDLAKGQDITSSLVDLIISISSSSTGIPATSRPSSCKNSATRRPAPTAASACKSAATRHAMN